MLLTGVSRPVFLAWVQRGAGFHGRIDSSLGRLRRLYAQSPAGTPVNPAEDGDHGVRFKVAAKDLAGKGKVRLDAYLASKLTDASRAKIAASIKAGLVLVNGCPAAKPSLQLKGGEQVLVELLPPEPCTAIPEDIPLNIVFEDQHVIVVNKAPGMVVHLSPGHTTGTLVNALLGHCGLGPLEVPSGSCLGGGLLPEGLAGGSSEGGVFADDDDVDEGEDSDEPPDTLNSSSSSSTGLPAAAATAPIPYRAPTATALPGVMRPGIVHRLDRGTSGLMVVAKNDLTHMRLCEQFKARTVSRIYTSVTQGCPAPPSGRVTTNVLRDPMNRLRMTTAVYGSAKGRTAASNYRILQVLAGGGAALCQWQLESGRTHQIRVHARHLGHPLLGDDTYGPGHAAAARVVAGKRSSRVQGLRDALEGFSRPALHARTLGFTHPATGERLEFDSELPEDFLTLVAALQQMT